MEQDFQEFYLKVGQNLAYYRKLHRLTQENFAEMVGMDNRTVSRIENAQQKTSLDFFYKAAHIFKIPVSRFFEFPSNDSRV